MIDPKLNKNFDFSKFNFDLSSQLNDSMFVVKRDIQEHIIGQKRIDTEGSFTLLKPKTIEDKSEIVKTKTLRRLSKLRRDTQQGRVTHESFNIRGNRIKSISDPSLALIRTGNLLENQRIDKATKATQTAVMDIGSTRDKIAVYQQEGTETIPERPFFGISKKAEKDVERRLVLEIDRKLQSL